MKTKQTPSFFCDKYPWSSVLGKSEHEVIALNIMKILKRTGDKFRKLSFTEYEKERRIDGNYSSVEKIYFDDVINYCKNSDTAQLFSKSWKL